LGFDIKNCPRYGESHQKHIRFDIKNRYKIKTDVTAFLGIFFNLYPTTTKNELAYYALRSTLEPIGKNYLYSELVNPVFVATRFINKQAKTRQVSQFELVLHKGSNRKIIG